MAGGAFFGMNFPSGYLNMLDYDGNTIFSFQRRADAMGLNLLETNLSWGVNYFTADVTLSRDAANTLALRRGVNAQTFRVYNTFTSATNFERLNIRWTSNTAIIDTEAGSGGGTLRGLSIGSANTRVQFPANGIASTPPVALTGTWFSGGTTTTTKPQLLIEPTGTTSNTWSTAGTGLGINAPSGFTGNLLDLQVNGVSLSKIDASGNLTVSGNIAGNTAGFAIGYRDVPQNFTNTSFTLALTDAGKHILTQNSGASTQTITIANNASVAFRTGAAITIVVQSTGTVAIANGASVTMYLAGTSTAKSTITLNSYSMATLLKIGTDTWMVSGTGAT
jgi:hypothetical protein